MEIEGEPGKKLAEAWLGLTPSEAAELRALLDGLLDPTDDDPEWHGHLTSADGSCELTLYRQARLQ